MRYKVEPAFIILDANGEIMDWRNTQKEAETVAEDMEQDDEDRRAIDEAFEAVLN